MHLEAAVRQILGDKKMSLHGVSIIRIKIHVL